MSNNVVYDFELNAFMKSNILQYFVEKNKNFKLVVYDILV